MLDDEISNILEKLDINLIFLILVVFNSFSTIPVEIENVRLKLALVIPTGVPVIVANDAIEMLPVVTD